MTSQYAMFLLSPTPYLVAGIRWLAGMRRRRETRAAAIARLERPIEMGGAGR